MNYYYTVVLCELKALLVRTTSGFTQGTQGSRPEFKSRSTIIEFQVYWLALLPLKLIIIITITTIIIMRWLWLKDNILIIWLKWPKSKSLWMLEILNHAD